MISLTIVSSVTSVQIRCILHYFAIKCFEVFNCVQLVFSFLPKTRIQGSQDLMVSPFSPRAAYRPRCKGRDGGWALVKQFLTSQNLQIQWALNRSGDGPGGENGLSSFRRIANIAEVFQSMSKFSKFLWNLEARDGFGDKITNFAAWAAVLIKDSMWSLTILDTQWAWKLVEIHCPKVKHGGIMSPATAGQVKSCILRILPGAFATLPPSQNGDPGRSFPDGQKQDLNDFHQMEIKWRSCSWGLFFFCSCFFTLLLARKAWRSCHLGKLRGPSSKIYPGTGKSAMGMALNSQIYFALLQLCCFMENTQVHSKSPAPKWLTSSHGGEVPSRLNLAKRTFDTRPCPSSPNLKSL